MKIFRQLFRSKVDGFVLRTQDVNLRIVRQLFRERKPRRRSRPAAQHHAPPRESQKGLHVSYIGSHTGLHMLVSTQEVTLFSLLVSIHASLLLVNLEELRPLPHSIMHLPENPRRVFIRPISVPKRVSICSNQHKRSLSSLFWYR